MCGCAGTVGTTTQGLIHYSPNQNLQIEDCEYTIEQLKVWLDKLICAKDTGLYLEIGISGQLMNKHLGIVMSAINYASNICYFQTDLDLIGDLIILINDSEKC